MRSSLRSAQALTLIQIKSRGGNRQPTVALKSWKSTSNSASGAFLPPWAPVDAVDVAETRIPRTPPVHNAEIARAFEQIADLLEIQDANPFRVRAYRNAAVSVGNQAADLAALVRQGTPLPKLPGIGADLAGKIAEIARTGTTSLLERLRKQLPGGVAGMLQVPGLGPKRVRVLYKALGVSSIPALRRAARSGAIRKLAGFGEKSEASILRAVEKQFTKTRRFDLAVASQCAETLMGDLRRARGIETVVAAGSLRRGRETVGDIDILATASDSRDAIRRLTSNSEVQEVISRGRTRASVRLRNEIPVDLRVVPAESYGAALVYFTGSRAHCIALRRLARARGLKINEYGVFRAGQRVAGKTEESVYAALGLRWIPPGLRENRGEIEAARRST